MDIEKPEFLERYRPLCDADYIGTKTVAILGLGRIGFFVAWLLALLGVKKLVLVDFDTVSSHDRGSVFPGTISKKLKIHAAFEALNAWNPFLHIETHRICVDEETLPLVQEICRGVDVVIVAMDSWGILPALAALLHSRVDCVVVGNTANYAEVAWSSYRINMSCVSCALNATERTTAKGAASLPTDCMPAAVLAVEIGIGLILVPNRRKGWERYAELMVPTHNLLVQHRHSHSGPTVSTSTTTPQLTKLIRVSTNSDCSACRTSNTPLNKRGR